MELAPAAGPDASNVAPSCSVPAAPSNVPALLDGAAAAPGNASTAPSSAPAALGSVPKLLSMFLQLQATPLQLQARFLFLDSVTRSCYSKKVRSVHATTGAAGLLCHCYFLSIEMFLQRAAAVSRRSGPCHCSVPGSCRGRACCLILLPDHVTWSCYLILLLVCG